MNLLTAILTTIVLPVLLLGSATLRTEAAALPVVDDPADMTNMTDPTPLYDSENHRLAGVGEDWQQASFIQRLLQSGGYGGATCSSKDKCGKTHFGTTKFWLCYSRHGVLNQTCTEEVSLAFKRGYKCGRCPSVPTHRPTRKPTRRPHVSPTYLPTAKPVSTPSSPVSTSAGPTTALPTAPATPTGNSTTSTTSPPSAPPSTSLPTTASPTLPPSTALPTTATPTRPPTLAPTTSKPTA